MERWELRRVPATSGPLVSFSLEPGAPLPAWHFPHDIIGPVRWFRDGQPDGPVLNGWPPRL